MPQHYPEVERFIASRLPNLSGKRILDVGCGRGAIGFLLRQHQGGDAAHIVGVDVHPPYLEFCRRFNLYDELILGTAQAVDLGRFDIVLACEVLAHIDRPTGDDLLDRLERLTVDRIIVTSPNGPDLRGPIDGIPGEARVSVWRAGDFRRRGYEVRGIGCRVHRWHRANRLTQALWYIGTPMAVRVPAVGSTLIAVKTL